MDTSTETAERPKTKILIITESLTSYLGADAAGQIHLEYPSNTYIMKTLCAVIFPEDFYLHCFEKGIDGIIVASGGSDCPYEGAYSRLAARIGRVYQKMEERGLDIRRLKLTAICSICTKAFVKEVNMMNQVLDEIGSVRALSA